MSNRLPVLTTKSIIFLGIFIVLVSGVLAVPFGANVTFVSDQTAPLDAATYYNANAGNVTELDVNGYSSTALWSGFFGNVSGTIQLADSNDNVMYNWSSISPSGQVYASMNSSIQWSMIQCLNLSADGTYADDTGNAGGTSQHGMNLSEINWEFNVNETDVDAINNTFSTGGSNYLRFYTANRQFDTGECLNTNIYDNSGTNVPYRFPEVLLYEPTTASLVYTSLIMKDMPGFDQRTHDFEMMVMEDGQGTNVAVTPYYFFVELQ